MKTLREVLEDAARRGVALGHFNISDSETLKAIFEAARELRAPVLIGVSEGEREFLGVRQAVALIRSLREEYDFPIFINADHTHSLNKVKEAAEAGYDEILFDSTPNFVGRGASGSKDALDEEIRLTKKAMKIIRSVSKNIVIEGEIGYIGSSSEVLEKRPEGIELTEPHEAARFVEETGIDVLAPAVGNMHGLTKQMVPILFPQSGTTKSRIHDSDKVGVGTNNKLLKHLDIERIKAIKKATGKFLTLHGGSGTADEDFTAAIKAGINIIHVSTELRVAWRKGIEEGLKENPEEAAPYKIMPPLIEDIKAIVLKRLKLFNGL